MQFDYDFRGSIQINLSQVGDMIRQLFLIGLWAWHLISH